MPKGPQLKIQHAARKRLEELGQAPTVDSKDGDDGPRITPWKEDENAARTAAGGNGDSDGKCSVCWEKEVEVRRIRMGNKKRGGVA